MSDRWLAFTLFVLLMGCQNEGSREQTPTFSTFCLKPAHWQDAISVMREFGNSHGLELHGGVEKGSALYLNVYLARGYSYLLGDDLDLWLTSNPYVQGQATLGGISKKHWNKADRQLARDLLTALAPLQCNASR